MSKRVSNKKGKARKGAYYARSLPKHGLQERPDKLVRFLKRWTAFA